MHCIACAPHVRVVREAEEPGWSWAVRHQRQLCFRCHVITVLLARMPLAATWPSMREAWQAAGGALVGYGGGGS